MRRTPRKTTLAGVAAFVVLCGQFVPRAAIAGVRDRGRSPVLRPVRLLSGGDEIPVLLVARGITTMLALPEEAHEALCGDLFDPSTGAGGYVVQRSGQDLFVKPLRGAGPSNLFVKTEHATYSFELRVVEASVAMRIVNVESVGARAADRESAESIKTARAKLAEDGAELDLLREKMEQEFSARRAALEGDVRTRATVLAREWVARAAIIRVTRRNARAGAVAILLAPYSVRAGGRTYLECTIRNTGAVPVVIAAVELAGATRSRMEIGEVVAPGATVQRTFDFELAPIRDIELRFVDSAGATLVCTRPFR